MIRLPHDAHSLLPISVTPTALVVVETGVVLQVVAAGLSTPLSEKEKWFKNV